MNLNLLYVSVKNTTATGGSLCRKNTRLALSSLKTVTVFDYLMDVDTSFFSKVLSVLAGYKCGFNRKHLNHILQIIPAKNIGVLFLDPALFGVLAGKVKKKFPEIKILSFFHNCEYRLYSSVYEKKNILVKKLVLNSVYKNECLALRFSDTCFFLTNRDLQDVQNIYGFTVKNAVITPIVLETTYVRSLSLPEEKIIPERLLFVGAYFKPNIDGIFWFVQNVLPYVDYTLTVVGKGFEQNELLKKAGDPEKLSITGFVDSLDSVYESHDIVVQPVFDGSGMKTKTAECLMYGKPLITSPEGMVGYDVPSENVFVCHSAQDFIRTLNLLKKQKVKRFDEKLQKIFLNQYSLESRVSCFQAVFGKLI